MKKNEIHKKTTFEFAQKKTDKTQQRFEYLFTWISTKT